MGNIYFELTEELNRGNRIAVLGSGQAVVWHRLAILSKDGDWIVRESSEACARVLALLEGRRARYRPGAPLDPRWLAGGWSSHFEFSDERERRVRCDFFSRPPRLSPTEIESLFAPESGAAVVPIETLIRMKRTQRAKDYAVIGELARRLPPEREIAWTTDPDQILELAPGHGSGSPRRAVQAALAGEGRLAVVRALAEEIDALQVEDRERLGRYETAAAPYLRALGRLSGDELTLPGGHARLIELALQLLPPVVAADTPAARSGGES